MKIAVFDPWPRVCSQTKWAFDVAHGFRSFGFHTDVVSFTKSGRPKAGKRGWQQPVDVCDKWSHAIEVLETYDLVVLNEPKCGVADANSVGVMPEYVDVMRLITTPWTTALHAPHYSDDQAVWLDALMESDSFSRFVLEHHPGSYDSGVSAFGGRVRLIQPWPWLPYHRRSVDVLDRAPRQWMISTGGKMTHNSGHIEFAHLAGYLPAGYTKALHGIDESSLSRTLYRQLSRQGWAGSHDTKGRTWWLEQENDLGHHVLHYTADYHTLGVWEQTAIAVSLTPSPLVGYTVLEAMDAGCVIVVDDPHRERTAGLYTAHTFGNTTQEVVDAVHSADQSIRVGEHDPDDNYRALDKYNNPRHVANQILRGVGV